MVLSKTYGITPKQHEVLKVIKTLINRKGYSPSFDEIAQKLNTPITNIARYVAILKKRGLIDYKEGYRRSIIILEKEKKDASI